ncbi:MAG: histidine kinase [Deltaproteobacteria bacterium]|nr:histidine kinase [Deltaproteobacteria bacterium]MBP2689122.1 histidine kinase [Deltaproteobacteria bacterium]MBS1244029.1 histidine kinase [Deltaproteobacteria bacterium]
MADRILVVDDEASLRDALGRILTAEGYEVRQAGDGREALGILGDSPFDFVLCDLRMPVMGGLELLREITARGIPGTVIMMSAFGTVETAVEAMKLGAYDYVSKPFMSDEILLTLKKAAERERLRTENAFLRSEIERAARPEEILYASRPMEEVVRTADKVKDYDATVLVTGESGTGKELVARLLHFGGRRKGEPFVALNCGAIPETLLESELFGHRRGAFTEAKSDRPGLIEEAAGGTLFLDEIGEFPLPLQTKLLRFLQDGEIRRLGDTETRKVNVRLVAATARDLEREVTGGRFREDLFYRLNVIRIHVPPLRERRDDIPLLASHFLSHYCGKYGKREMLLSADALEALSGHEWRGNVRELRNVMERCALLASGAELSRAGLLAVWKGSGASGGRPSGPALEIRVPVSPERPDLKAAVRELERQLIRIALERTGGSRPKAAELLGISHPTLLYKAKEFGIEGG